MAIAAAGEEEDRISELPDDILLCILRRLNCSKQSAQTVILSKRWRSICESYHIVEFHPAKSQNPEQRYFRQFAKSRMYRFSREIGLRMEDLKVELAALYYENLYAFEQLLDLALERKVEEFDIDANYAFNFQLLSNSAVKILRLRRIVFNKDNLPVIPLNSVRFLNRIDVESWYHLRSLLATIPQLETLEIEDHLSSMSKLHVPNLAHLKALQVSYSCDLEIEEIAAPGLQTLRLSDHHSRMFLCLKGLPTVFSSLQSLKSLTSELERDINITQIKFPSPKLEEFTLHTPRNLEEIEVDAGSSFVKFYLYINDSHPLCLLNKCEIRNAAANCRWEAHCGISRLQPEQFARFNDFVSRFNNKFHAIKLRH